MNKLPPSLHVAFAAIDGTAHEIQRQYHLRQRMSEEDAATMARLHDWHGKLDGSEFPRAKAAIFRKEEAIRHNYHAAAALACALRVEVGTLDARLRELRTDPDVNKAVMEAQRAFDATSSLYQREARARIFQVACISVDAK